VQSRSSGSSLHKGLAEVGDVCHQLWRALYVTASAQLGIGVAVLQKVRADAVLAVPRENFTDLLLALDRLRKVTSKKLNTFELIRGTKVFDRDRLYLVKPIGQRFWTQTAALNDADEIAGTILMHTPQRVA
jgi:hypothetical protein